MDFKVVLTSVQIEPVFNVGQISKHKWKTLDISPNKCKTLDITPKFRLEGACYCDADQKISNSAQKHIMWWMEQNLLHPHDIVSSHQARWGSVHKINFMVFFEDEGDAILFFLTFK